MNRWKINTVDFEADEINPGLAVSPWSGHRQFAYDLIAFTKPQRVVELGTHYGCSFFSFLQACKDFQLSTEVIAIDCWEGDEQAGFYGGEVINTVKETLKQKFPTQNAKTIRKFFTQALGDIEDESVDILHIDGLHTYEAVTEDYNTWLCKLKPNGIVLFHDVDSELNYGTNIFWEEMRTRFPHSYTFSHSWGLGILFPKGELYYEIFSQNNMEDKILIYEYKARFELANRQLRDHVIMVQERDDVIRKNEEMIAARDEAIKANEAMIVARDEVIKVNEAMIVERDNLIKANEALIKAKDKKIEKNELVIEQRDKEIKISEEMIKQRNEVIKANEAMIADRDKAIKANEAMIADRDEAIKANEAMIADRDKAIRANEIMIVERDEAIKANEKMILDRDETIKSNEAMIVERDNLLKEQDALIKQMEEQLRDRDEIINNLENKISEREGV